VLWSSRRPLHLHLWLLLTAALVVSVVTDLMSRRILDVVTLPTAAVALGVRLWADGLGTLDTGLLSGVVSAVGAAGLFAILALRGGGFGWGDVKLMLAVGAVFGYPLTMAALVFISLAGALQAVVTLLWHGAVWDTFAQVMRRLASRLKMSQAEGSQAQSQSRHIPYGVAIALGSFWAMWWDHSNSMVQGTSP